RVALVVVLTPIAWGLEKVFEWFFNGRTIQEMFPALPDLTFEEVTDAEERENVRAVPPFIVNSLKFFAVMLLLYAMYRIGRLLVGRRDPEREAVEETRSTGSGGAGLGTLLADLV